MLKTVFIAFAMVLTFSAQAQYADLLRNPNITWVGEYTADFTMDTKYELEGLTWPNNSLSLIRLQPSESGQEEILQPNANHQQELGSQLFKRVCDRTSTAYVDSTLQNPLPIETLRRLNPEKAGIDLLVGCSPAQWTPDDITSFRIRQVFWYNAKTRQFGAQMLAYAPVYDYVDAQGIEWNIPFFWLPAGSAKMKQQDLNHCNYIFQTQMLNNAPGLNEFKVIKGNLDLRQMVVKEMSNPAYQWLDAENRQPIDAATMHSICYGIDTIQQYVYETGNMISVVQPRDLVQDIEKISFVQNWYYDERRGQFYSRLLGWAPLVVMKDEQGFTWRYKWLFYQTYNPK